jgi:hypothetical protein
MVGGKAPQTILTGQCPKENFIVLHLIYALFDV